MAITNCTHCKERPVKIKKRGLCLRCYGKLHSRGKILPNFIKPPLTKEPNAEMNFIKNYFTHKNWTYQPATFYIGNTSYRPDFYDGETGFFIEVISTRQAYEQNKYKYALLRLNYPTLSFEVRKTDGSILNESDKKMDWTGTAQHTFCKQL